MYKGEVSVEQRYLESFLNTAEELKVKGLSENGSVADDSNGDGLHEEVGDDKNIITDVTSNVNIEIARDESEPIENPHPLRAWRARHDLEVVGLSNQGIRGASVRPGLIYGNAGGWLTGLIFRARETGKSLHIGEGTNLVSSVHVNALSDLYLKIVTNESAQGIYNAASDEVTCSKDYATLIADYFGPNIEVVCWPLEEAREAMGELADLSCIECIITSDRARSELGWLPIAPSVATELSIGSYRTDELIPYSH